MKQLFALIASFGILIGALGVSTTVVAQDKDKAAAPAATAPAPAAAPAPAPAPAAAAPAADSKAEPPKADAAAAPAAAPPAPTTPQIIGVDKINSGDTAWMLASTALVLLMTIPGLALFYGGMVRKKNVLATLMQSFAITCLVTVLWVIAGYSIAFMPGGSFMGSLDRLFLNGMLFQKDAGKISVSHLGLTIPESVYMTFQMTFAIITPALIAGAFADRMKFSAMLWFIGLWSIFIYSPIAHMMWEPSGYWAAKGVLDFAGGTVVHINAGIAGLVCALVLGKRIGYGKESMAPHNLTLTLMGASLLWVGWFGFNAGSAVAADGRAGMAMVVTQLATAVAALAWMFTEWMAKGKPSVLGIASGAVAGLVAITPASGFVGVTGAFVIGIAAGVLCFFAATTVKKAFGYDDSLDAFGVHCIGGIVGALLTGVFNVKDISGADADFLVQLGAVCTTLVYTGVGSFILLKIIDMVVGLRVSEEEEREGLDISLHGERVE
ncbi:MAG TPA: ammonium transporter [Casimicrobiaceae bacterium]|jgi:Amt family ammonium transporter|nr:ammonium transporter [Casimicrobiaceae bacterium]